MTYLTKLASFQLFLVVASQTQVQAFSPTFNPSMAPAFTSRCCRIHARTRTRLQSMVMNQNENQMEQEFKSLYNYPQPSVSSSDNGSPSFLRLIRTDTRWFELQTAVVSYFKPKSSDEEYQVDLFSMVHLADPLYYRQLLNATSQYEKVLYELIVDEDVVERDEAGWKRLKETLVPANDERVMAARNGFQAQLEAIDYCRENWFLADLDRKTIKTLQAQRGEGLPPNAFQAAMAGWGTGNFRRLPESLRDLIRKWLRAPIWLVPCPEGAMLMLDWAMSEKGSLSEVLMAMLDSVRSFNFRSLGKLAFGQLLVSGTMACDGPQTVIISERNKEAIHEILRLKEDGVKQTALLYGGLHGPDLDRRLRTQHGFQRGQTRWLTAWRIAVPEPQVSLENLVFLLATYLCLDGIDWLSTISSLAEEISNSRFDSAMVLAVAYLARHGILYYSVGRWFVAWDKPLFVDSNLQ